MIKLVMATSVCAMLAGNVSAQVPHVQHQASTHQAVPHGSGQMQAYISGGVGKTEQQHLKEIRPQYNLKLTNADAGGAFTSGVDVQIFDAHNKVLVDTVTQGPILLAKLPAGKHKIVSTYRGATKTTFVEVSSATDKDDVVIRW